MDIPGSKATSATIDVGGSVVGALETIGDHDWFRIDLSAGEAITVSLDGITLEDPYLRIRDASGNILYENDDISSGVNRDSLLSFTASYSGTYYVDVGSWNDGYTGDYSLQVSTYSPPPFWTNDEIADQLTSGYWAGDTHRFNVDQGGSITVNITALTAAGKNLAREALGLWSDIIGIEFVEVATGGQITFDDNEDGAFSEGSWANGFITSNHVNISTGWLATYGSELGSYSFQTYLHEIGHALGLGHAGNYNESARYPYDALFENDGWPVSVMSYFSPSENLYFDQKGFSELFVVTPMVADVLAMAELYGLSATTRTGNTTYGFNSNADRAVFDASQFPDVAVTIFDSGGNDTLDYSGYSTDQLIDLNPESFSNVGNGVGNVAIARGVTIENATGGSGDDRLVGNDANNRLSGGTGNDTASYAAAAAGVTVSLGTSSAQATGGAGTDTLLDVENLTGSPFSDQLTGNSAANVLLGDAGDDVLRGGLGNDTLDGGAGRDTASFADAATGVTVDLGDTGRQTTALGSDLLRSIENLAGSEFDDDLTAATAGSVLEGRGGGDILRGGPEVDSLLGGAGDDSLFGNGGNDELHGGAGVDRMYGGTGDDRYNVTDGSDYAYEAAGEGIDTVHASLTNVLRANVENMRLQGGSAIDGFGNGLGNLIVGNSAANALNGKGGDDDLLGEGGNDRLVGEAGNDRLTGGAGLDRMYGGIGDDIYVITDSTDYAYESPGDGIDTVHAFVTDVLMTNVENLRLLGAAAIDGFGNGENNLVVGNSAANSLNGKAGHDQLFGEGGNDRLVGEAGDDRLEGGTGLDRMYGGLGDDVYIVADSTDYAYERAGEGIDLVYASVTNVLRASVDDMRLTGTAAINGFGNSGANALIGNSAANSLNGKGGDDRLYGRDGDDRLYGEDGNDQLDGGRGLDLFFGGAGADDFLFRDGDFASATAAGADRILDYRQAEGDRLRLDLVDADTGIDGDQSFDFLGTGEFTGTAGELRYGQAGGSTRVEGDLDGDGIADFAIRIDGLHTLASDDFLL